MAMFAGYGKPCIAEESTLPLLLRRSLHSQTPRDGSITKEEARDEERNAVVLEERPIIKSRLQRFLLRYRLQLLCGVVLFVFYAYFYSGMGWNQNSRFDLTRAIVEEHTVRIDSFHQNTGDKAFYNGHYYSDKAPGLALAAVPIWGVTRTALKTFGKTTATERALSFGLYTAALATVALPAVIAMCLLFSVALKMGASPTGAAFSMLAVGLGTPMWAYATLFWGHAAAGSFLVFAFVTAFALRKPSSRPMLMGIAVGAAAGWATVIEYPAGPAAALLAGYALFNGWRAQRPMLGRVAGGILCGAMINIAVLGLYNHLAFGSVASIGYAYNVNFPEMRMQAHGFFGTTYPSLKILKEVLLGWRRGLLPLAPVLVFAIVGIWTLWRTCRVESFVVAAVPLYYALFNASFNIGLYWTGGFSYGPRYLAAGIFFLMVPLSLAWTVGGRMLHILLAGSAATGAAMALIAVSTWVMPTTAWAHPIVDLTRAFVNRQIPLRDGTNIGIVLGLEGHASLVPLLVIWLAATFALWKTPRHQIQETEFHVSAESAP
jgi:hypothetical protein